MRGSNFITLSLVTTFTKIDRTKRVKVTSTQIKSHKFLLFSYSGNTENKKFRGLRVLYLLKRL